MPEVFANMVGPENLLRSSRQFINRRVYLFVVYIENNHFKDDSKWITKYRFGPKPTQLNSGSSSSADYKLIVVKKYSYLKLCLANHKINKYNYCNQTYHLILEQKCFFNKYI